MKLKNMALLSAVLLLVLGGNASAMMEESRDAPWPASTRLQSLRLPGTDTGPKIDFQQALDMIFSQQSVFPGFTFRGDTWPAGEPMPEDDGKLLLGLPRMDQRTYELFDISQANSRLLGSFTLTLDPKGPAYYPFPGTGPGSPSLGFEQTLIMIGTQESIFPGFVFKGDTWPQGEPVPEDDGTLLLGLPRMDQGKYELYDRSQEVLRLLAAFTLTVDAAGQ